MNTADRMCSYCDDNPAEPKAPCCDNTHCRREYAAEQEDSLRG